MVSDVRPAPGAELVELGAKAASSARELAECADIVDIAIRHEPDVDPMRSIDAATPTGCS